MSVGDKWHDVKLTYTASGSELDQMKNGGVCHLHSMSACNPNATYVVIYKFDIYVQFTRYVQSTPNIIHAAPRLCSRQDIADGHDVACCHRSISPCPHLYFCASQSPIASCQLCPEAPHLPWMTSHVLLRTIFSTARSWRMRRARDCVRGSRGKNRPEYGSRRSSTMRSRFF